MFVEAKGIGFWWNGEPAGKMEKRKKKLLKTAYKQKKSQFFTINFYLYIL